ncbi:MAG: NADH-quinone oxidoreductase subunit D [Acidobacteriota bacterium]
MFRTEELDINMGPQHPSTHGVLRLKLMLNGEEVTDVRPIIGYLHRGVEKLSEHRTYSMIEPLTDRLDYVAAVSENLGYCGAVEKLMGIQVPPRARYIRVVLAELQRIASHLLWLGTHALDIGAMTVFFYTFREREMILDLLEQFCGARLTYNSMRIGGLLQDLPGGWIDRVRHFLRIFPAREKEYEDLLTVNRIWLGRTKGVGILKPEDGVAMGVSGPSLRGSGVNYDVRKAQPYSSYEDFEFDVPLGENGDTYDRYLVRMEEMRQSCRIIRQALDRLPGGEVRAKVPKYIKPPAGEVYHVVESPRGEQGFHIVSTGGTMPYRMRFRAPSFVNLQALPLMCRGGLVADVVAVIGSIDIVLGDVDR